MTYAIELINSYSEVNSTIINRRLFNFSTDFDRATNILLQLKEKLNTLEVDSRKPNSGGGHFID
jgi:hypothetical protein